MTVLLGTVGFTLSLTTTDAVAAPPASDSTVFSVGAASVATITDGSQQAPWNTSQGDTGTTAYPTSDLLPTYTPGGPTTGSGSTAEPNVAVYPAANSGTTAGNSPYPSGVVGTPGPLDGYCGSGSNSTESSGSPVRQPVGTTLPFSPAYFPHVVRNSDGSLTGYFDERPKDGDESVVAAVSTDNGKDWTYEGQALEQNPGYCPTADINDDGEGHPNVVTVGGVSRLYTLGRPAGDNDGVGLLVHTLTPTATDPLAGLPATEQVGLDPDAFATGGASVPFTGGAGTTIAVNQTGQANSLEQLVAGPFVDLTQTPTPTASSVITCTGVGTDALTGCTSATSGGVTVDAGDLIEQVIGTVNAAGTIPKGPNNTLGTSGTKKNLNVTFTSNQTATMLNTNAPNRVYVNGVAVYCPQANSSPTTTLEYCTTGPQGSPLTMAVGAPVTADPIVPATAEQTTGLVAPDGIVGALPTYPGLPSGYTAVLYTEKLLNYYVAGHTSASAGGTYSSTSGSSIQFYAAETTPAALPTPSTSNPVTVEVADDTKKVVIPASCTGLTVGSGSVNSGSSPLIDTLTGCTVPSADNGDSYTSNDEIGVPGMTLESPSTLAETGEGSTNQDKLYKNNEDLTVLRVAYTDDGINFSSAGLDNDGIISGQSDGASTYTDINNPSSTIDPPGGLNQYASPGTTDATEMRFVGSAGSIITNPDGSIGLFLSGAWSADGDSDAFNQIFYSSSTDGEHWTEPVSVVSTDYTFSASRAQDVALAGGTDAPLGVSAYYSGRAYGPSVVQNPDGSLTMVFAGYRLPSPIGTAGTSLGTDASAQYTVGATDPALYRNIMVVTLDPSTSPLVGTSTSVTATTDSPVVGQPVTFTATVGVAPPGAGTPTGTVTFTDPAGTLCTASALSLTSPDTATCTTTYTGEAESDTVTATYSGDANYATSNGSLGVDVSTVPDAPTAVDATAADQSATVSWTAADAEGSAVTGYTVTAADATNPANGGEECSTPDGVTTTCTVTGLTNGDSYTFTVIATNADGPGAASAPSNSVVPSTVPDAPADVVASPGDGSATVSWSPASGEGSPVTGYTVTATGDGGNESCSYAVPAPPATEEDTCAVTGLTNGDSYTFTVIATNADGPGAASGPSNSAVPSTVPDAPTDVVASAANGAATVTWAAPNDEGSPIVSYTVTATDLTHAFNGGETATGPSEPLTVSGLTNGDSYTFTVVATNADGEGGASGASNEVTPTVLVPVAITSAPSTAVANGRDVKFEVTATGYPSPTITATGLPSWLKLKRVATTAGGPTTATLSGRAPATSAGAYVVTIEASNGVSAPIYQTFTVDVLAVTSPKTAAITTGTPVSLDVTTSDTPADPTLAVSGLPSGLSFTDSGNGNGVITGTVPAARRAQEKKSVKITATSGSIVAKQTLVLTVAS